MAATDDVGDYPGPPSLVSSPQPGPVVAVEVLVEKQVVLPRRVGLEPFGTPERGPSPVSIDEEDRGQAAAQVMGDLFERQPLPRAGRVLDLERVLEEAVVALEGPDDQEVDREPKGPRQLELPPNILVVDSAGS